MKTFLDDNFLLQNDTAVRLYHEFAKPEPIIDYHCHLPPAEVASNHRFGSLTEIWLNGDHYKWRALRSNGVPERLITGDASDWEKFEAWAKTVPYTLRNPLYHWTHLELRYPFGVKGKLLNEKTAREIYDHCNGLLAKDDFTTQGLLRQYKVLVVCTTDDPIDSLEHHAAHAKATATSPRRRTKLYPTWRPDKSIFLYDLTFWNGWVGKLEAASGVAVNSYATFLDALKKRHDAFHAIGCRASDHGLETFHAAPYTEREIAAIFDKARAGKAVTPEEIEKFRSSVLYDLALWDHARGWTQQFHFGAMRNNNARMMRTLGPDTGFDSIGDWPQATAMSRFFDRLDSSNQLAKTILYNLNPADNDVVGTMIGNFQDGSMPREDAVRQLLVVPGSAGRHGEADQLAVQPGPAVPVRRHVDRQPQLPVVLAPRVLPPPAVQHAGHRRRAGDAPQRHRPAGRPGPRRLLPQRQGLLRLRSRQPGLVAARKRPTRRASPTSMSGGGRGWWTWGASRRPRGWRWPRRPCAWRRPP